MKRSLLALLALAMLLGACGESEAEKEREENEEALPACTSTPPPPSAGTVSLPSSFPTPESVTYLATTQAGPSSITTGIALEGLGEVYREFAKEMADAQGFTVDKKEKERRDAEVFFSSNEVTGQVKLEASCDGVTEVKVTVRPK